MPAADTVPAASRIAHSVWAMPGALWREARFADRLYAGWFVGLGLLIAWQRPDGWPSFLALHLVALALIATLVAGAPRWPAAHAWYPLLLPLATFPEVARLNLLVVHTWQDASLIAFEGRLFAEPPTVWLPRVTPLLLGELFRAGYLSYFVLLLGVAGLLRRRGDEAGFRGVLAASVLAYLACYVVFLAWPMEGPAHTLRHLAADPAAGGPVRDLVRFVQRAGVHGNAFPSAHVAGALPPLVFAWLHARPLGLIVTALVMLMGLGAVLDGYHYASDVVAGAAIGAAAAAVVLVAQQSPTWTRRLHLPMRASRATTSGRSGTRASG